MRNSRGYLAKVARVGQPAVARLTPAPGLLTRWQRLDARPAPAAPAPPVSLPPPAPPAAPVRRVAPPPPAGEPSPPTPLPRPVSVPPPPVPRKNTTKSQAPTADPAGREPAGLPAAASPRSPMALLPATLPTLEPAPVVVEARPSFAAAAPPAGEAAPVTARREAGSREFPVTVMAGTERVLTRERIVLRPEAAPPRRMEPVPVPAAALAVPAPTPSPAPRVEIGHIEVVVTPPPAPPAAPVRAAPPTAHRRLSTPAQTSRTSLSRGYQNSFGIPQS